MDNFEIIMLGNIEVIKVYCGDQLVYLKGDETDENN